MLSLNLLGVGAHAKRKVQVLERVDDNTYKVDFSGEYKIIIARNGDQGRSSENPMDNEA